MQTLVAKDVCCPAKGRPTSFPVTSSPVKGHPPLCAESNKVWRMSSIFSLICVSGLPFRKYYWCLDELHPKVRQRQPAWQQTDSVAKTSTRPAYSRATFSWSWLLISFPCKQWLAVKIISSERASNKFFSPQLWKYSFVSSSIIETCYLKLTMLRTLLTFSSAPGKLG